MVLNYFSFVVSGWLWNLFTKINADLVFTFEVSPMTQALIGVWYSKKRKIPNYLYVQDLWPENVETVTGIKSPLIIKPISRIVNYIYGNCEKIFATSPSFVQKIQERTPGEEEKVIYWPQYAEDFYRPTNEKSELIPQDGILNITFTGNIGSAQGLEILPETALLLKKENMVVRFNIVGDGRKIALVNGAGQYPAHSNEAGENAIALYKSLPEPNIFGAAPMLIDDYEPVGAVFVPDYIDASKYEKESAFGHQGNRHPRTAYALTEDNDLLLVIVDGRTNSAKGMTAKELTLFLQKHFNPRWALNMDGGGSSAMYIKGHGSADKNNIINNFTDTDDNGKLVERSVSTHLIIQKVAAN